MCGRYSNHMSWREIHGLYRLTVTDSAPNLRARYNVCPTDIMPVIRWENGQRRLAMNRWGLVPFWSKDGKDGAKTINARAESVTEKPSFRDPFKMRRCLVPADGYYEWKPEVGKKQPYLVQLDPPGPMTFAGLWDSWVPKSATERAIETYSIITTAANASVSPLHDRMPLMLAESEWDTWLSGSADDAKALLRPISQRVSFFPVSQKVNTAKFDDPACIERSTL